MTKINNNNILKLNIKFRQILLNMQNTIIYHYY